MIDPKKLKEIKKELKELGFKEKKFHLGGKSYNYDTKETFSMHIRFYETNPYLAAQIIIDTDGYIDAYYNYNFKLPMFINIEPDKLDSVISAAKKSIKIITDLNKKFRQITASIEKFQNLV